VSEIEPERYAKARALVQALMARHWESFSTDPNVLGAAFGRRITFGEVTDVPALVIYVARKAPRTFIPRSRLLPRRMYVGLDSIDVDVLETGPLYPYAFAARERPAPSGISVGNATDVSAGTLGCLVTDNTDGSTCILSNNHVLARENLASIGEAIIQPGAADGGTSPADDIATLKRFVSVSATGTNRVDAAIAQVTAAGGVVDSVKNNLMPVASSTHRAVGLLHGGSCVRDFLNPIDDVLTLLNARFPAGAGSTVTASVGMKLEKVGQTSEYTTADVMEIGATVSFPFGPSGTATWTQQIATASIGQAGDSGSLVCEGGSGGTSDRCGFCPCLFFLAGEEMLGRDLREQENDARAIRDRYLRRTAVGRYAVELVYLNEDRLLDRVQQTRLTEEDREYARELFEKYDEPARSAMLNPEREDPRVTQEHFSDARQALERARKYMTDEEAQVAEELLELATAAEGRNWREILAMMEDEAILDRFREIVSRITTR
jgi:hypothetical protein